MVTIDEITKDEWIMIYDHLQGDGHLSIEGMMMLKELQRGK